MWKLKIIRIKSDYNKGFGNYPEYEFKNEDGYELFLVTEDPTSYELLVHFRKKC
jgi:hypothetical protein